MDEHCREYASWVARSLPSQLGPYVQEMSWDLIRKVCDRANGLRRVKWLADQTILKAMEVTE